LSYKVIKLERHLNIITLNILYPPDYGGVIDSYYRIKALHEIGVKIHLHCFAYGRSPARELESLCESVEYYPRKNSFFRQFSCLPFIVNSRRSEKLLNVLTSNKFPILFDGLHTSFLLSHPELSGRKKFVRLHNLEHNYYQSRAEQETNLLKKLYFRLESFRLRKYEKRLTGATAVFPLSYRDHNYFRQKYGNSVCIEPFHPYNDISINAGSGNYVLYHGDMSVNENEKIAWMLVNEVFSKVEFQCIIAGRKPSGRIINLISQYNNIKLVADPDTGEMMDLVANAHIHLIPASGADGFKLKLLCALVAGRHIIANRFTLMGSGQFESVIVAGSASEMVEAVTGLIKIPFDEDMISVRRRIYASRFDNETNAAKMIETIFQER